MISISAKIKHDCYNQPGLPSMVQLQDVMMDGFSRQVCFPLFFLSLSFSLYLFFFESQAKKRQNDNNWLFESVLHISRSPLG